MHFANLTYLGFAALVAACLTEGAAGRFIFLPVTLFITALSVLQQRIPQWARDGQDERRSLLILLLVQALLDLALFWYRPMLGTGLFIAGGALNLLVFTANGLRMPHIWVSEHSDRGSYCPLGPDTQFPLLADRFTSAYRSENGERWAFSLGDILELLGIWALATELWFMF